MATDTLQRPVNLLTLFALLFSTLSLAEVQQQSAMIDGQQRSWRLFIPGQAAGAANLPLLFNFHGTGSTPEQITELNQLEVLAEREHFIVVAPQAEFSYESGGRKTWNVEQLESPYNDVAFISGLITHLQQQYPIDTRRIYATGFSGGARMSSRLACDLSDTFAAIAPIAGIRFADNCVPTQSIPVLTYHGINDPVNHYTHQDDSPRYWRNGVEPAVNGWVAHNGCRSHQDDIIQPGITKVTWSDCHNDVQVIFFRSDQGGHTWPGSPQAEQLAKYGLGYTDALPMTEILWTFLRQYQRQP